MSTERAASATIAARITNVAGAAFREDAVETVSCLLMTASIFLVAKYEPGLGEKDAISLAREVSEAAMEAMTARMILNVI